MIVTDPEQLATLTKPCSVCGREKTLIQFSPHQSGKYGRLCKCKSCAAIHQALYRATDQGQQVCQAYRQVPGYREKQRDRRRRWLAHNRERARAINHKYMNTPWGKYIVARRALIKQLQKASSPEVRLPLESRLARIDAELARLRIQRDLQPHDKVNE